MNEDMYRENILDHYKKPHHRGKMALPSCSGHAINPFCGDDITFYLRMGGKKGVEKVEDASFEGQACAICTASASMLTDEVKGKNAAAARTIGKERVLALLGISPGPTRLKCALLPLKAFKLALYSHLGKMMGEKEKREIEEADEGTAAGQAAGEEAGK
ncbi:MAG: iron-sulfur cluster assembly scaffold protein [Candidatus Micrarchaeota archaeon]|nr:iron-sulfur cluster assembly scaffold protein [Candidatus Micrarchaeota archaeon]